MTGTGNNKKTSWHRRRRSPVRLLFRLCLLLLLIAGVYWAERTGLAYRLLPSLPGSRAHLSGEEGCSGSLVMTDPSAIPPYSGQVSTVLTDNVPAFSAYDTQNITGEHYAPLDALGRCGPAYAMLDRSMMPDEERGEIGLVRPSGWQTAKYPDIIEDLFLYNRCHLIAYAMTGQNDNEQNLITGTRYFNVEGMLPYEIRVLQYLARTDHHVLYRVSPYFAESELVARGVEMEAWSVEDSGTGLCFHVFVYNVQPGIGIDYATGHSWEEGVS